MTKWEYLTIALSVSPDLLGAKFSADAVSEQLNEKGALGWELVSSIETHNYQGGANKIVLIFKRPRSES